MTRTVRFTLTFFLLTCMAVLSLAQNTNSGDIRGTVKDSSGAVIPGVTVNVTNLDTAVTKQLVTNNDGLYDTAAILPGNYQVTFIKDGFDKLVRGPITVLVGIITVNADLRVGSINQQVTVSEDVPLLQTENPEQSTTFEAQTLANLPQVSTNGQNWGSFANLLPGASGAPSQPTASGKSGDPGIAISVNGNLPFYDNFLQDGASTNLPISANVDISTFETISELQISTSTFSAQYGIGGAVFNQVTKSGTNRWHGAAYEYLGNDWLNAYPYNFSGKFQAKPIERYHNFGGSVGGPIFKDKLFFYFNVDKVVNHGQSTGTTTVPTLAMRSGDFTGFNIYDPSTSAACPPLVTGPCRSANGPLVSNNHVLRIDPVANALQAYFPKPNVAGTPQSSGLVIDNYFFLSPTTNPFLKFFGRLDYNVSEKQRINFSITQGDNPGITTNQNNCPINCYSGDVDRYNAQVTDVYAFSPQTINEARFGFTRQGNWFIPQTLGKGFPQKVGLQFSKADVFPQMNITNIGGILTPGTNAVYIENQFEPSDIVTMIRGKHILHFGGELMSYQANYTPWGNVQSGVFGFTGAYTRISPNTNTIGSGYADFLLGYANNWGANNQPESGMRMKSPQVFVQDDYKLRSNFTLNLGLRYERQGGWSEVKNHLGTFDPTLLNSKTNTLGAVWFAGQGLGRRNNSLQAPIDHIFLPRIGFAWNPGGTTVIRAGFGIYAFTWSLDTYGQGVGFGSNSSGNASDTTNLSPITILSGPGTNAQTGAALPYLAASKDPAAYNGQNVNYNQYHTPVGTMKQWSLSIQRQLGANMEAEVAYIGSHGSHLDFPVNVNQIPLSRLSATATAADRPYPQFANLDSNTNNAISNYNSLQVQVQRRFSGGLSFSGNYTWSHFLDDQDSSGWGSRGGTQVYQNAYNPHANYGSSNFDQRHAIKGSVIYDLPFGRGRKFQNNNSILDAIIGGWQTAATLVAHSGQPFTVTMATSNSKALAGNQFPNVVGDWHLSNPGILGWYNTAAFAAPAVGTFGNERRNGLVGPRLSVINFSMGKNFKFTEGIGLQLRVDASNILNHPSFGNPNTTFGLTPKITGTTIGPRAFQLDARVSF